MGLPVLASPKRLLQAPVSPQQLSLDPQKLLDAFLLLHLALPAVSAKATLAWVALSLSSYTDSARLHALPSNTTPAFLYTL